MEWSDVRRTVSEKTLQQFGYLLSALILGLAVQQSWIHGITGRSLVIGSLAVCIALTAWSGPQLFRPIYSTWMMLVFPIGWTVSRVVLAAIYFGLMTPLGLILRWRGHDPLFLKTSARDTFWRKRREGTESSRYLRQY